MTQENNNPLSFEEAIEPRFIIEPQDYGNTDLDAETMNWSSLDITLPTGDKLGVFKVANTALYRIGFTKKTADQRQIPSQYQGMYTSPKEAQNDIVKWVRKAYENANASVKNKAKYNKDAQIRAAKEKLAENASTGQ